MRHPLLSGLPICLALVLAGCQASLPPLPAWQSSEGHDSTQLGQIRELSTGRLLNPEQLVERLADAPRVLVGEKHDNPDHHALQLWLLQALDSRRPQGSLLLEMLEPGQQARVDAQKGKFPADLPKALDWQVGWGWNLYGPIVREALARPYPLLAANLTPVEIKQAYRQPSTPPGPRSNAPAVVQGLREYVRAGHCDLLPASQLPAMLSVQQQRDRRMAERLLDAPQPAMLFAGSFHARKDLGVALHLIDLGARGESQVLLLAEVGEVIEPAMADYVWFTAALPAQDYCAQLRKAP
ncbi:ChaN family lipoprotein [Pseudomonas sp. RIT623]|uniref:ChaN family lipoprotein n=1 Tax=Pseudomonas sp. RIT623 TaxID=2559075 RepID=UPI00106F9C5D|nr:ChaN family lipoprotein [Pseudomonas sp. RIT623]TFF41022.1 iron(III) ABC transporter [Pseudomonas sp. RIT623]